MNSLLLLLQGTNLTETDSTQVQNGITDLTKDIPIWDLVMEGGWVMIPLALLSIATVYIFVERFLFS